MRLLKVSNVLTLCTVLLPMCGLVPLTGCFVSTKEKVIEKQDNPPVVEHDKTVIDHR